MKLKHFLLFFFLLIAQSAFSQNLDTLKLSIEELPAGYKVSEEEWYKSIQAATFYKQVGIYKAFLGEVKNKTHQSYESKADKGTVYYFEFKDKFEGQSFLDGLLWGGKKPSKEHPEEYLVKDNILIIWSFAQKSELKKKSKEKVNRILM